MACRAPTSSKKTIDQSGRELYANLCEDSHGGPQPIIRLIDPADSTIQVAPIRTHRTPATLAFSALVARDQAVVIAALRGIRLEGTEPFDTFDTDLKAQWAAQQANLPKDDDS